MNNGFITLHRKFLETSFIQDAFAVQLSIYLLLKANHETKKIIFNGKELEILRGQCIVGRHKLALETGNSPSTIRNKLELLKNIGFLDIKTTNKFSIITICKYNLYQDKKIDLGQQASGDNLCITKKSPKLGQDFGQQNTDDKILKQGQDFGQPEDNQRTARGHKQQCNNDNNKNNKVSNKVNISNIINNTNYFNNDSFKEVFENYLDMRIKIKKPATDKAQELILKKLSELSNNDVSIAIKILEQSILNSWQGVFALKQDKQNPGGGVWNSKL